ncbi:MAG: hypothetical protein A2503_01840 [Burkholderiales bacterium RIFOXYD12_FULL_59_19]|nr:MAG: hypothetical protein A2503_01840 [Burkholderiales bacterium RIFOXYD12_FULL_59_19]
MLGNFQEDHCLIGSIDLLGYNFYASDLIWISHASDIEQTHFVVPPSDFQINAALHLNVMKEAAQGVENAVQMFMAMFFTFQRAWAIQA